MTPHERAGELVERIGQALMAGDRPLAVKIAEQALQGLPVMNGREVEGLARDQGPPTLDQQLWRAAGNVTWNGTPERHWRGLVGKLIKHCGKERALEAVRAAQQVIDPVAYIAAWVKQGEHGPTWALEGDALTVEADRLNVPTYGKTDAEVKRGIEEARRAERTAAATGGRKANGKGIGAQALRSA